MQTKKYKGLRIQFKSTEEKRIDCNKAKSYLFKNSINNWVECRITISISIKYVFV